MGRSVRLEGGGGARFRGVQRICYRTNAKSLIHPPEVPVRALMVDAGKGSVGQHDVVFVACDRRGSERTLLDAPRAGALRYRLTVDDRGLPGAQLAGNLPNFQ